MNCTRCKKEVPDFLWVNGDHPVLIDHPITLTRDDDIEHNIVKITASARVERRLCSEVFPDKSKIFDWTTATEIETAVGEAIGAASVCWETPEGADIFDSTRAQQIVDELVEYFMSKGPIY